MAYNQPAFIYLIYFIDFSLTGNQLKHFLNAQNTPFGTIWTTLWWFDYHVNCWDMELLCLNTDHWIVQVIALAEVQAPATVTQQKLSKKALENTTAKKKKFVLYVIRVIHIYLVFCM